MSDILSSPTGPEAGAPRGANAPRGAGEMPTLGELEARWLHKALALSCAPAGWPAWLIGVVALLPIGAVSGLWWLVVGRAAALVLAAALAFFCLSDALVLVSLPRLRLSFGPVGPQLYGLELPRLAVAALALLPAAWWGPAPALVGLATINLGASLALVWGALVEPFRLDLSRLALAGDPLPHDAPPVHLLHISDIHVERFGQREELLLRKVRTLAPDLIVLTGDYVNLSYVDDPVAHADTRRLLAALATLAGPGGIYAVLGSPPVDRNSAPLFDGLPIHLLRGEMATVDLGDGRRLALLGLDCSHDPQADAQRLAAIAAQAPANTFRVLLYHSPELAPVAPELDINLYLCGHTHGGQVRLPLYGAIMTSSKLGKRFEMGHYQVGQTDLYVSRGVGLEGMAAPRVRFLSPPEIALFSLNGRGKDRD
jgi:predicted MPP superfamily phosphohydrolase